MDYVGLPKGAVVQEPVYAGLPAGAKIISPPSEPSVSLGEYTTGGERLPTQGEVRTGAQLGVGGAVLGLTKSPAASGAAATLAGIGVDALYGKMAPTDEYTKEGLVQVAFPGAVEGISYVAKPYILSNLNKMAKRLYQSGAKFFPGLSASSRNKITETALRDMILPQSQESLDKIIGTINAIDDATEQAILKRGAVAGEGISMGGVKEAKDRMISYYRESGIFSADVAEGLSKKLSYVDELPAYMTPQKALEFRRKMNRDLSGYFGNLQKQGYSINENAMTMTTARMRGEMNQALYESIPELKALGAREGELILLEKHIERTLNRLNNRDILPLSAMIAGSVAGSAVGTVTGDWGKGGVGGLGIAAMFMLFGSPNMKARIAFTLARGGGLTAASESTLALLNITRQAAAKMEPRMKALPFPKTMGTGEDSPIWDKVTKTFNDTKGAGRPASFKGMNELDLRGLNMPPAASVPPAESSLQLGKYGGELSPPANISQGGVPTAGVYDYPLGQAGGYLSPPEFAGILPQRASVSTPMPSSRNILWQAYGKGGSNPAYSISDDEFLKAVGRKITKKGK